MEDGETDESLSIYFFSQYFPPETGAASNRVDELTNRWSEAGHDVTIITSAPDYPEGKLYDGYDNDWHLVKERDGVTVHMTKTLPASNTGMARRALKFVWFMLISLVVGLRTERTPDVVIATSPQPLTGVSAAVVSTLRNALFVFEVRDLWPESITSVSDVDNPFLIGAIDAVVRLVYQRADRIVVVSRAFEDDIESAGVAPDSIWYHPNGVDPSFVTDTETATPLPDSLADTIRDRFVVSYVGTVGRAHGLEVVLDGAAELAEDDTYDDVCFLVVGYGTELDTLRSAADRRGLDNVVFTGRKPKAMVPSILSATDVSLVHLKPRDLFETVIPSKIFESMGAGLPIVLGVRGEAERILREADAGVPIPPGDGAALADAVRDLYDDPDRRATLGENGARFVREEFAWDPIATAYRQQIERLATGQHNA